MEDEERIQGDEKYVAEQEEAAAEEAAEIGGNPGRPYEVDEAERPLAEGGSGQSEGFELAEEELIENATHEADDSPDPTHLQGEPEEPQDPEIYGEPDTEPIEDA